MPQIKHQNVNCMDTDKRVAPPRYTICLLIWVAKFQTSHVLQSNKNNNYWGCCDRLSDSIIAKIVLQYWCQVEGWWLGLTPDGITGRSDVVLFVLKAATIIWRFVYIRTRAPRFCIRLACLLNMIKLFRYQMV